VKFMLMMQATRAQWASMATWKASELHAHIGFMVGFAQRLAGAGELVMAEGLDMPAHAKVVTSRGGPPVVSEGPFAETKEFLAGFWLVDVPSAERAIAIAAEASAAPGPGGKPMGIPIEVRAVPAGPPPVP
jgi:hypothetical protein